MTTEPTADQQARDEFSSLVLSNTGAPATENDFRRLDWALKHRIADQVAQSMLSRGVRPDYTSVINAEASMEDSSWLVGQVLRPDTNTGFFAPTSSGGSTFQLNLVKSLLTGEPFLDYFDVFLDDPTHTQVVWINPEEANGTPRQRLHEMKLRDKVIQQRFFEVATADARFHLDNPVHVEALIEALAPKLNSNAETFLFVDGATTTVSTGNLWNEALEGWKVGYGQLKLAIGAKTGIVRVQVTGEAARQARRYGNQVNMEDAKGAQFAEFPDQRLTYSYPKLLDEKGKAKGPDHSRRKLELRGRRVRTIEGLVLVYHEPTGTLSVESADKFVVASAQVARMNTNEALLEAVASGEVNVSVRGISKWFEARSEEMGESISASTFKRALNDERLNEFRLVLSRYPVSHEESQ